MFVFFISNSFWCKKFGFCLKKCPFKFIVIFVGIIEELIFPTGVHKSVGNFTAKKGKWILIHITDLHIFWFMFQMLQYIQNAEVRVMIRHVAFDDIWHDMHCSLIFNSIVIVYWTMCMLAQSCKNTSVLWYISMNDIILIDQIYKFHNAPVPCPIMHHWARKHICSEWCNVGYGTGALWEWYINIINIPAFMCLLTSMWCFRARICLWNYGPVMVRFVLPTNDMSRSLFPKTRFSSDTFLNEIIL